MKVKTGIKAGVLGTRRVIVDVVFDYQNQLSKTG